MKSLNCSRENEEEAMISLELLFTSRNMTSCETTKLFGMVEGSLGSIFPDKKKITFI